MLRILTSSEQVARHLRDGVRDGRWRGEMPGAERLAEELGVGHDTVDRALRHLEQEGILVNQGRRRPRRIAGPVDSVPPPASLRVAILRFDASDKFEIKHLLAEAGHKPFYPSKTLFDLRMDVEQVARWVDQTEADAWVVVAASREVLECFAARPQPAFALFGRRHNVGIASVGPETTPTIVTIARRLIALGHQRIVMLSRSARRLPKPGEFERTFLAELEDHGCPVGAYNLPHWVETREGFHRQLKSLFHLTPPTALIIHEAPQFIAALRFLAERGIRVPQDVSLICTDPDPSFAWCDPPMAHINWDARMVSRRVLHWASNVHRGKEDRRQTNIKAEFIEGGTIGPAKE